MQSILTASIYAIAITSVLYFTIGLVLHLAHRFNHPTGTIQPEAAIAPPAPEDEPASDTHQVDLQLTQLVTNLLDQGFFSGEDLAEPKLDLHGMTYRELQQECKDRYISIRDGRRWLSTVELIDCLTPCV
jgi:hypothetical protein